MAGFYDDVALAMVKCRRITLLTGDGQVRCLTNLFLLEHSAEYPELLLRSEEEYRLYTELKRAVKNPEIDDESNDLGFKFNKATVLFEKDEIHVYRDHKLVERYTVAEFTRSPNAVFRKIKKSLG